MRRESTLTGFGFSSLRAARSSRFADCGNENIGFIVSCVASADLEEAALEKIRQHLAEEQLKIDFVTASGLLSDFFWKDEEFTRRIRSYGQDALTTERPFFDTFHSWVLKEGKS